jgi:hypothetical protein
LKYYEQYHALLKSIHSQIDPFDVEHIINNLDVIRVSNGGPTLRDALSGMLSFRGIPITNFTPLSEKAEVHRCTLVAPYDSGQEMLPTCVIPTRCGINYSFDGYWPCSAAPAIARLFKLDKYNMKTLPDSLSDIDGINEDGHAVINKKSGMWDVCKLCQTAAKTQLAEKDHGRPISISYRKALGLEESDEPKSKFVVDPHAKKLSNVNYGETKSV